MLYYLAVVLYVLVCLSMMLVVSLQQGKGGDIAAAFGGGSSQAAFGARSGATVLSRATTICAVLFMVFALALGILGKRGPGSVVGGRTQAGAPPAGTTLPAPTTATKPAASPAPAAATPAPAQAAPAPAAATPAPAAPAPAAAPAAAPARSYLVFFDWDKATLTDRAKGIIKEAAENSRKVQYTRIEVNGYTDTSGKPQYNQGLSVRRAQAVAAELVRNGVARNSISIQGFGDTKLLVPTGPNVREPQNRRVEIIIR